MTTMNINTPVPASFAGAAGVPSIELHTRLSRLYELAQTSDCLFGSPLGPLDPEQRRHYLAAWSYALRQPGGSDAIAREFVKKIFLNVPVLDTGGRGASTTFAQRGIGDVLLTFENEAVLTLKELGDGAVELVVPSLSVLAENPVVWVDKVVEKRGTANSARAYLNFLFGPVGQELAAKYHFRPIDPAILAHHRADFPDIPLISVPQIFGSWAKAQGTHFVDGGIFDQIYTKK